jgi:A/G-specific adenine glycosylase
MENNFTSNLINWHLERNKRTMPWKGEKDPYKIWISEIVLQQTRVKQGLAYYNNFIKLFPDLKSLSEAPNEAVFKSWEGLGYYSRCKNILFTARHITADLRGKFPDSYENLLKLKGIGPYTAAAISSFAYGLPHAVVDGNVFRVLARFFGEAIAIDSAKGKKFFTTLANMLLFKEDSAAYNQALMDFGATVCTPKLPDCFNCVFQKKCVAYNCGLVNELPVKEKRLIKRKRFFTYFIFLTNEGVLVRKRIEKDIWENLYEFCLFESNKELHWKQTEIKKWLTDRFGISNFSIINISNSYTQQLTHQTLLGRFVTIKLPFVPVTLQHFQGLGRAQLSLLAFPKFINQYLQEHPLTAKQTEKIVMSES